MNTFFLTPAAKKLIPYVAGEQPTGRKYIKLNTNENPYPASPLISEAIEREINNLRLYPDANSKDLCRAVARIENLKTEDYVFVGNGSDEVLSFIFYAFFSGSPPLLFPDITYSFYPVYSTFYDISYSLVPLRSDFTINPYDYMRPACGVIFPNPNAPTGISLKTTEIVKILEYHKDKVVCVDEAYVAFGSQSMAEYIDKYPNLLIVRTLSKSHALAGLRVGFAIGQPHLIDSLRRVKDSFNSYPVDRLAAVAAAAAISDTAYYCEKTKKIIATRDKFTDRIKEYGFNIAPSSANFVFCAHRNVKAAAIYAALREQGVLVRHFCKPRIDDYLRITIGTDADMDIVAGLLRAIVVP